MVATKISTQKSLKTYLLDIWQYRELLWILAKRDLIIKYKQSILGIGWSAIRPLITTLVMAFAFGKIGKLNIDSPIPFVLIVTPGVIIWLFFSQSLSAVSQSLVSNANLITKVYFPRMIIPLSTTLLGLVDVLVALCIFLGFCFWYSFIPDFKIILVPLILLLFFFSVYSIGLFFAVMNVKFRDIGQLVPFIVQFGYFLSPIGYTTSDLANQIGHDWKYQLFCINPVTGAADVMRWAMLGNTCPFNWDSFIPLIIFNGLALLSSFIFFRKHEKSFVDFI